MINGILLNLRLGINYTSCIIEFKVFARYTKTIIATDISRFVTCFLCIWPLLNLSKLQGKIFLFFVRVIYDCSLIKSNANNDNLRCYMYIDKNTI